MNHRDALAGKLLQINAIKLSVDEPFTWASGWKSPIYCDNRKALSFPAVRGFIKDQMCEVVRNEYAAANLIAGVATAGIPWGAVVADHLKLPFIYVRPKPKEHGLGNQVEGYFESNSKVVLIEDLISTGKSSLQAAAVLKDAGLEILGVVSIFNYGFDEAKKSFSKSNLKYTSLTDYDMLISNAIDRKLISESDQNTLLNWRRDPSTWNVNSYIR